MLLSAPRLNRQLKKVRKAFDILCKMRDRNSRQKNKKIISALYHLGEADRILTDLLNELLGKKW